MNGLLALTTRRESLVREAATNGLVTLLCLSVVASALQYAVDLPMRYAFVLAGLWLPWLRAALPPSVRRQTGCVVQVVALIGCLVPLVPPPWSAGLATFGLVVLTASFTVDITWLVREARRAR